MDEADPTDRRGAALDEEERRADPPPGDGRRTTTRSGPDRSPDGDGPPVAARVGVASAVIAAILAAFLHRVAAGDPVPPWLVGLVSVLGLAAAAAVLGTDAVRTAAAVLRGLRR